MWLKWSFAPAPFTPNYVLGFIITAVMIGTIALWLMSGCKGWRNLIASTWHIAFCVCLIFLTLWAFLSQFWAFGLDDYPGLAQTASLQLLIVMLFTFVVIAASPPIDFVIPVLIVSMLIHGSIGGLQVIFQSDIGLDILGEFSLDVAESGVSVLESNGERWLRPYGLLPHPNVLAGIIAFGILASAAWILESGKKYGFGIMSFVIGFWFLMLTFSRSAWIGFLAGVIFAFPFVWRVENFWKKILPVIAGTFVVGCIFVAIFHPLLLSRAGVGEQNTELRSVSDRIVYMDIAWRGIREYPVTGVGAGNYPWYASNIIFYYTDFDLRGDNVHNIYLSIASELGFIGFALFSGVILSGFGAVLKQKTPGKIALLAGFFAWMLIGLFDHYMWTLVLTQSLWFGILGAAMSGTDDRLSPSESQFSGVDDGSGTGIRVESATEKQSPPVTTT